MQIQTARPLPDWAVDETASPTSQPVEWWYANALIEAPGTPVDGLAVVGIFSKFDGLVEEGRHLLLSRDGGLVADFGTGPLAKGTITGSTERLEVRNGENSLAGAYPHYELHLAGDSELGRVEVDLAYTADAAPEREGYVSDQFKHWVIYRNKAVGSVKIAGESYPVTGLGYLEHLFGTLGWLEPYLGDPRPPVFINGWNWYWSPSAGPSGVAVQAGGFITDGAPTAFASLSTDGENFVHFTDGAFTILETRTYEGVEYVHSFRLTDTSGADSIDLTFTRADAAQRAAKGAGSNKVVFVSGFTDLLGHAVLDGVEYDLTGPAFGSVFKVSLGKPLVAFRQLPNAVRVPIGQLLRLARRISSRGN